MQDEIRTLNNQKAAYLICQALDILQKHGTTQKSVSQEIGFSQLSKIRSYNLNKNKTDGRIASRSMPDLLLEISQRYGFTYDPETESLFRSSNDQNGVDPQIEVQYVFYYHENQTAQVVAGLITFLRHKRVKLELISAEGMLLGKWLGESTRSNPFLFLDIEKKDGVGVLKGMHSYYIGNTTSWQPYYVGTFSGIKPDGSLIVGKNVLVRLDKSSHTFKDILQPIDYRIQQFLTSQNYRVKPFLPQSLTELVLDNEIIDFFEGTYSFYFNGSANNFRSGILEVLPSGQAKLTTSTTKYFGSHSIIDGRTLQIELVQKTTHNEDFGAKVYIHFNIYRIDSEFKVYSGVGIGRSRTRMSYAFPCVIISPKIEYDDNKNKKLIRTLLNGELANQRTTNTIVSPSYNSIDDFLGEMSKDDK